MQLERGRVGRFPYAATGSGPPVVVLAGLSPTTGVDSDVQVRAALAPLRQLAARRRLMVINRRPDLPGRSSMQSLAAEHAEALRVHFGTPVDVVGMSTGGSIAQQLAADHGDAVRRLVLISTACRLGPQGRAAQHRVGTELRAGRNRRAIATASAALVPPWRGRHPAALAGWLLAPRLVTSTRDRDDLAATIEAEDGFDLARCDTPIQAPTLIVAGARDRFYSPALFAETARLIPHSRLHLVANRGHITVTRDRAAVREVVAFLGGAAQQ